MTTIGRGIVLAVLGLLPTAPPARADSPGELAERLRKATAVLSEMAGGKQDTDIPREMLARARAIAVFPGVKKGAVIVGGRHGQGVMSVKRLGDGHWSPPAFFTVGGGSFGLQLGGQVIDLVLVVMTEKGIESLLKSETTLGGDVSLTAGPKSLHDAANTDGSFKAEIFSYARSSGFFAGASFEGATMQPDGSAIRTLYGAKADSRDVLLGGRYAVPASGRPFVNVLTTYSPPPKKR
ncbi:MAG: lipid-binding SYLF domain-containing protein [Candidatus Rokuibacteriota bacterium]|jgi:lipid-binding SYLF domain-containing protein